jgi:chemotaxis response regulator CheB
MRIGIVNDAIIASEVLRRVILRAGAHDVAWIAHDGADAVARCERDKPDLILMDLFMPKLDGIQATKQIMAKTPCAIMITTAKVENHTGKVFEAMGAGALDAVSIPVFTDSEKLEDARELLGKIETINRLVGRPKRDRGQRAEDRSQPPSHGATARQDLSRAVARSEGGRSDFRLPTSDIRQMASAPRAQNLIAIGSSAGGPAALTTILGSLPADIPAAVVIIQHVDKQFAHGLTAWFTAHTKLQVRVAHEGDRLEPGVVYIAGQDRHLVMFSPTQLGYSSAPIESSYCPSVDVFFRSVAKFWPRRAVALSEGGPALSVGLKSKAQQPNESWRGKAVGVLLTGMGRDGAEGLKALRDAGHHTIAQDKGTSAIYGMPKAAAELDAAKDILALEKIGPRLALLIPSQA